jgi:hypothetical protein
MQQCFASATIVSTFLFAYLRPLRKTNAIAQRM